LKIFRHRRGDTPARGGTLEISNQLQSIICIPLQVTFMMNSLIPEAVIAYIVIIKRSGQDGERFPIARDSDSCVIGRCLHSHQCISKMSI
jgi:hypothetical protein